MESPVRLLKAATLAVALIGLGAAQAGDPSLDAIGFICGAEKRSSDTTGPTRLEIVEGMGSGGFRIRTGSDDAQAWFDHGIKLFHAFYHNEAKVAFDKAAAADPNCMMCVWGQALSHGSTQNFDVEDEETAQALGQARRARQLATTDQERALADALVTRYQGRADAKTERAFAEKLEALATANPNTPDLMDLAAHAWLTAARRGDPRGPGKAMGLLEGVLKDHPQDSGAIHYYIHATEFAGQPAKAEVHADRLAGLAPKASHLVHMAAHTYIRVGRYHEASTLNARALQIDAEELAATNTPGSLSESALYYGHNYAFGIAGALLSGDGPLALKFADHLPAAFPEANFEVDRLSGPKGRALVAYGLYAPDRLLAMPEAAKDGPRLREMRHYARGEVFAARGDTRALALETATMPRNGIARLVLEGRGAMLKGDTRTATRKFDQAARQQERIFAGAMDPPPWWYPVRRSVAAAKLKAGDAKGAAAEARRVLQDWPKEPLSLLILSKAETALGETAAAQQHLREVQAQWRGNLSSLKLELI